MKNDLKKSKTPVMDQVKKEMEKEENNPHFLFIKNAYKWYQSLKSSDKPDDISTLTILEEQHKLAILRAFKNLQTVQNEK